MKAQPTQVALAVATALGTLAAFPANALQITSSASFSGTASATDTCGTV